MILIEAIKVLKPGQKVEWKYQGDTYSLQWEHGAEYPNEKNSEIFPYEWRLNATITDLPKPPSNMYDILMEGAKNEKLRFLYEGYCCTSCSHYGKCNAAECHVALALVNTLQDVVLKAGIDLKKITAEAVKG